MTTAPCHRSKNPAFIHPTPTDSPQNRAAVQMCGQCPFQKKCATDALQAGTTIDGHPSPANDVVQGGVVCRGDLTTAWALAEVAGVPVPAFWDQEPTRRFAPEQCRGCDSPMTRWTRDKVPEGYSMHHARGFCTNCRAEYRKHYPAKTSQPRGLRKQIDRKRHTAPKRTQREVTIQLSLFGSEIAA